jgi:DNA-binding protein YbaB
MSGEDSARLIAELDDLRAQAEALSRRLSAPTHSRLRHSGSDRSGLVRVTVAGRGRATDVAVSREWRRQTDHAGLAAALVEATGDAQARRLEHWASAGEHTPAPPDTTLLDRTEPPAGGVPDSSGADLIRDLLPLLDEAERQLDRAQHQLEKHFTERAHLTSPGRELTITAQGGQVTEIQFDDRWIASATAEEVAHHVCHLFQIAHDRAWIGIGDLMPRQLDALMSLAADPQRMLRQLGFQA